MTIRVLSATQTYLIRKDVLRPGGTFQDVQIAGDESAFHLGIFAPDLVGVASLFAQDLHAPGGRRLRKLAVLPQHQGKGFGKLLIDGILAEARARGAPYLWFDARVSALGFYQALGFQICSEPFVKNGRDYVKMQMPLHSTATRSTITSAS